MSLGDMAGACLASLITIKSLFMFVRDKKIALLVIFSVGACMSILYFGRSTNSLYTLSTGRDGGLYSDLGRLVSSGLQEVSSGDLSLELVPSAGSIENLELLRSGKVDFAFAQADAAYDLIQAGQVFPLATIAQEDVLIIAKPCGLEHQDDARLSPLSYLKGCSINAGVSGSGVRFTAERILGSLGPSFRILRTGHAFSRSLDQFREGKVDALFYVGRLDSKSPLISLFTPGREQVQLHGVDSSIFANLTGRYPGTYSQRLIQSGRFSLSPVLPSADIKTISVPTVLLVRTGVDPSAVRALTWSILSGYRRFAPYYPSLLLKEPQDALAAGLQNLDPAARDVYANGDPRQAWLRYWERNADLQAGVFLLFGTSFFGFFFRYWVRQRSKSLVKSVNSRLLALAGQLEADPKKALAALDEIVDEIRLQYIANRINDEAYGLVVKRVQSLADKCRAAIDSSRRRSVLESLVTFDEWQTAISRDPEKAMRLADEIKSRYSQMLLDGEIDVAAYIELTELVLLSEVNHRPS